MDSYTIDSLDDLTQTFAAIRMKAVEAAAEELRTMSRNDEAWKDPRVFVNGRAYASWSGMPDAQMAQVLKDFSTIIIVPREGPVQEAVHLAYEYIVGRCMSFQNPSGFYASNFLWFVNGEPVSQQAPDVTRMGLRGNVQVVNRAGYAAMPEIFIPDGIIYGAFRMLERIYGKRIALSFSYGPAHAFGQVWPGDRKGGTSPLAVPVLTIGHPSAGFKGRATRPGVRLRKRSREMRKDADRLAKRLGLEPKK